jgi:hypothetical protein
MPPHDPATLTPALTTSPTSFTPLPPPHPQWTSLPRGRLPPFDPSALVTGNRLSDVGDVMVGASGDAGSTGKGILIGILSAFGSAGVAIVVLAVFFFLRYTRRGRILLDRIGRPGEFDDEQAFAREEAEALETMDDLSRSEYLRAKG